MGGKIDTIDPIFQCLLEKHEGAGTKQINPLEEYEVSESELGKLLPSGGFIPPTTLYLDISIEGCNNTNGLSSKNALRAQFFGDQPLLSLTHQEGLLQIGIPLTELSIPWFGIGNIYYQPGGDAALGWFSTNGSLNPYLMGIGGGIVLIQSIFSECSGAKECGAEFLSNLSQAALPVNVVREIMQNAKISTEEDACRDVWDNNSFAGCVAYSASYKRQGLHKVAYDMVEKGLKKKRLDPYATALLMAEKDTILASKNKSGLTPLRLPIIGPLLKRIMEQPSAGIADNITASVSKAKSFMDKYGSWLSQGSGTRPTEEEVSMFMADSLYLLLKLQLSADVAKKRISIRESAPIAFRSAKDIAAFLETTAEAYNAIAASRSLWSFVASEISERARAVIKEAGMRSTESVLNLAFELSNLFAWKDELSSSLNRTHFEFRRAHLKWKIKKDFPENKDQYLKAIGNIDLAEWEKMKTTVSEAFSAIQNAEDLNAYGSTRDFYGYLDRLFLLSERDRMGEIKGLDFRGAAKSLPVYSGFELYYNFLKTVPEMESAELLYHHMNILLQRIAENRSSDIKRELAAYGPNIRDLRYNAVAAAEKLHRTFTNDATDQLVDFLKQLETAEIGSNNEAFAIEKDERDKFYALIHAAESNLRYLQSGTGFDKETAKEIHELINECARAFRKFSSYRNGTTEMRIYMRTIGK